MIFNALLGRSSPRTSRLIRPLEAITAIRNAIGRSSKHAELPEQQKQQQRPQVDLSETECLEYIRAEAIRLHESTGMQQKLQHYNKNSNSPSLYHNNTNELLVQIRSSTIQGAGKGIFTNCNIPAGKVLATYGGTYIPPIPIVGSLEPLETPQLVAPMNNDYTFCCEGGGFIDGSTTNMDDSSDEYEYHPSTAIAQNTPSYDIVQFANHHGDIPNTVPITIPNFPQGCGVTTMKEGTPWYYSPEEGRIIPMPPKVQLKSVALVSLYNIPKGTELFFDYGINPPEARPEWYVPLSEETACTYLKGAILEAQAQAEHSKSSIAAEETISVMQ